MNAGNWRTMGAESDESDAVVWMRAEFHGRDRRKERWPCWRRLFFESRLPHLMDLADFPAPLDSTCVVALEAAHLLRVVLAASDIFLERPEDSSSDRTKLAWLDSGKFYCRD